VNSDPACDSIVDGAAAGDVDAHGGSTCGADRPGDEVRRGGLSIGGGGQRSSLDEVRRGGEGATGGGGQR
jgi:hypothetical protein